MKKLILWVAVISLMGCAATTSTPPVDPYKNLTVEKVAKFCKPTNLWNVGVLGNPAMIVTFEHCLEVNNLLLVTTPVLEKNQKLSKTIVSVVHLTYVAYLNDVNEDKTYTAVILKETYRISKGEENDRSHVTFYSVESTKKTK
jgi:hypothetical protein|tara:strand:+ start:379 stop:807 length:429 start_codon:yes stop_codon:yes gene_type:complete